MGQIHRVKKSSNYVVLHKEAVQNEGLSWKAKGLFTYIMSLPDDWKLFIEDLSNRSTDGRDSTAKAMNELIEAGYVTRTKVKDKSNKFLGYDYNVFEESQNGFTVNGKTVNGKTVTTNNTVSNYTNNNYTNKKEGEQAPPTDFFLLIEEKYFNLTKDKQFAETRGVEFRKMEITITEDYIQNQLTDKVIKAEYRQYKAALEKQAKQEIEVPQNLNTSEFLEGWKTLINTKKWKAKEASALQSALKQLSKFDVIFACELVQCAIAGNWQGVVFSDTEDRYKKWQQSKQAGGGKVMSAMERYELAKKVDYVVDEKNFF